MLNPTIHDLWYGVAPTERQIKQIQNNKIQRAGGECICGICQKEYRRHPFITGYDWVNVLCNGSLVKL